MKPYCGYSIETIILLRKTGIPIDIYDITKNPSAKEAFDELGFTTVPQVYMRRGGRRKSYHYIGNHDETIRFLRKLNKENIRPI